MNQPSLFFIFNKRNYSVLHECSEQIGHLFSLINRLKRIRRWTDNISGTVYYQSFCDYIVDNTAF